MMLNQNFYQVSTVTMIRFLQIVFLLVASWSFFWAHIYEMSVWNKTFVDTIQSSLPNVIFYMASIVAVILLEIPVKRRHSVRRIQPVSAVSAPVPTSPSAKAMADLQRENELLKHELRSTKKVPSNAIGIALIVAGAVLLVASIIAYSEILAFMGLGLTFWGILFLFVRSTKFVRGTVLGATATSSYSTFDRMIEDLKYKGNAVYIPPYPKGTYLPDHLAGLKEMVLFVSAENSLTIPALEEMAKKQFMVKNPRGLCFTPPGSELVNLFEKELRTDFTKLDKESFYDLLPTVIVNSLELARNFEINTEKDAVNVKIVDSVFSHLYSKSQNLKTVQSIGCPLTSAVGCALAIQTGKPVTITRTEVSPDLKIIQVWYKLIEG